MATVHTRYLPPRYPIPTGDEPPATTRMISLNDETKSRTCWPAQLWLLEWVSCILGCLEAFEWESSPLSRWKPKSSNMELNHCHTGLPYLCRAVDFIDWWSQGGGDRLGYVQTSNVVFFCLEQQKVARRTTSVSFQFVKQILGVGGFANRANI